MIELVDNFTVLLLVLALVGQAATLWRDGSTPGHSQDGLMMRAVACLALFAAIIILLGRL